MKLWSALLAGVLVLGAMDAEAARRLGGGRSIGKQSGNVTQREAAPQAPATPGVSQGTNATQAAPAAAPRQAQPAAGAAAQAPRRPWGGMLGGLAAGLGLAWLANALGFGAEFAQFLLFALLALVIMVVVGMVMRRRAAGSASSGRPYAFAGAGAPAERAAQPRHYSPDKVGNDASARPWERSGSGLDASRGGAGVQIGSALAGTQGWGIPADFDVSGFVEAARRNFISLQDAWDRADLPTLRAMMTDEMLAEIRHQLDEREAQRGSQPNKTEVVMLDAQLLGIEDLGEAYMASVEFSGLIREDASAGPNPFREVWNMTKPKDGRSGWLVAGVQALQ
ncbi:Tim44 domain-containing protein [Ramlibacter rhizophilus]|uniref:Tim44 domain-containing protein n=2 Tax=Ramlibacter rhizophilus TaxID=1781167 RepID=A0A4Z0BRJ6_9BURK|nr:Tim44 domain-containing protein [Ramlibacter rhizophilus]